MCVCVYIYIRACVHECVRECKPEVRMQSKNAVTIVHTMVSMCGMHKLYVCYLEHRYRTHVGV